MKKLLMSLFLGLSLPVLAIECPKDMPMEKKGKCYSCKDSNSYEDFSEKECNKCPEFRKFENGRCTFTKSPYPDRPLMAKTVVLSYARRGRAPRRRSTLIMEFFSCDELRATGTIEENCMVCPNRKFENGSCVLKECPQRYFQDDKGNCLDCSHDDPFKTRAEECHKCPNRQYENGVCGQRECIKENFVKTSAGACVSCQNLKYLPRTMEKSECQKCANSEYKNGQCSIKCSENEFRIEAGGCIGCKIEAEVEASEFECNKCLARVYDSQFGKCRLKK